jgi:hypothetical protein
MEQGQSTPVWIGPDDVEREFAETLRQAAWIFEKEKDGRFQGSIVACRAVARFIYQRGGGAELAGPFIRIKEAFEDLEKGGKPTLFSKKTVTNKERSRSPERKVIQRLAAAALEVLHRLGDPVDISSDKIARHVNGWRGMDAQEVTGATVVAWRKQLSRTKSKEFRILVEQTLAEPDPRSTIGGLLRNGPPGQFR